jgi:hypothetical protein
MALATDIYFPALGGTRRPLLARFTSDNEVAVAGVLSTATITWNNLINANAGQTFIASFGAYVITFTVTSSPSHDTGIDLPTGLPTATTVAGYLDDNYLLTLYFDITVDVPNSRIIFTAKQSGAAYTLTLAGTLLGSNYTLFSSTPGVDEVRRPNFQAWADLYIEPAYLSGNFTTLAAKLSATRAADGGYFFDVSAIVDAYTADYPPTYNDIAIRVASDAMLVRYLVKVCEAYGSPIAPQAVSTKTNRTALRGRNSIEVVGTAGNTLPTGAFSASGFQLLTGRPLTKAVTKAQNEFLYLLTTAGSNWRLTASATFTDNTTGSITPLAPAAASNYQVYAVPVGYNQLGIGSINPAKTVRSYSVNIEMGYPSVVGDITLSFTLMDTCPPHIRYLVFRNELGGYDTLQLQGALQRSGQAERQRGQYILPENYTLQSRQSFDYDTMAMDEYELHTGYHLTKEEAEYYLRQLLLSENVLLQDATGFTPVTVSTKEANYTRDKFNLYGMALKLQRSLRHADQHTSYRV